MSRNNEEVENEKLFKSIKLEIEENFKSEVDKRCDIYIYLNNNAATIVSEASKRFLAEKPKLGVKGGIIHSSRDMAVFLRDMNWLLKIVVYSIFQKVQPTQLSVFKSVLEKVIKDSAIKKLSKQDTAFAIETLEETAIDSLNEEPVIDSDFLELLEKYFGSLKDFFFNFSFNEESQVAREKQKTDSSDQHSEKKVMTEEKVVKPDLMSIVDDGEFLQAVDKFQHQKIALAHRYFYSVGDSTELTYRFNSAKNRGLLKTLEEEKAFRREELKKINPNLSLEESECLTKEEIKRYQRLMTAILLEDARKSGAYRDNT